MPGTTKAELFVWRGEEARPHPNQSVAQYVLERLKKHAREATFPAQVMATTGSKMSFRELLRRSVRSADAWRSAGLGPGRVVAVFAKNSEALFPAVMGALFQGVTFTAINHMSTEAELRHCLSLVQPDAILCDPSNAEMAQRVADKSLIVIQDGPVPKGCRAKTLEKVLAAAASDLDVDAYEPVDVGNLKEHVAVIVFSSGSTGLPKAVMISNRSIVQSFLDGVDTFRCVYKERMMISSPMSWITGIGLLLHCTMRGTTRICDNFTTAAAMLANLRKYEANCWFTAAPLLKMVVEAAKSEGGDGTTPPCPSLRAVVVGGTAMSISMHEGLSRELQCEIFQAYASTEMLACATTRKQMRLGSAGQLLGGIHARLVDAETGAEIRAAGQVGELRIYSQYLMLGYKDDPEATAEALDEHGYFRSGDLASFDEDGFLYIVGRVKDQLKFRAHQVAPLEIEAVLLSHPGVGEACVVGRPHPNCGDVPAACVARRPGREEVTEAELLKLVASQLSDAKRLRGGIVFATQIPKNSNGKVARRDVLALFEGIPMQDVD